ncbi:HEPN domain-containing protein [Thermococcus sp.]
MRFEACIERGYFERIEPSEELARLSINRAKETLISAGKNFEINVYEGALMLAYLAMFHAARAVLYRDGWREKSHARVSAYLREFYVGRGKMGLKWIRYLDYVRNLRHQSQYDVGFIPEPEIVSEVLDIARGFVGEIEKLIGGD